jgi:hypothetical protein
MGIHASSGPVKARGDVSTPRACCVNGAVKRDVKIYRAAPRARRLIKGFFSMCEAINFLVFIP